jgi:hypothetical protein
MMDNFRGVLGQAEFLGREQVDRLAVDLRLLGKEYLFSLNVVNGTFLEVRLPLARYLEKSSFSGEYPPVLRLLLDKNYLQAPLRVYFEGLLHCPSSHVKYFWDQLPEILPACDVRVRLLRVCEAAIRHLRAVLRDKARTLRGRHHPGDFFSLGFVNQLAKFRQSSSQFFKGKRMHYREGVLFSTYHALAATEDRFLLLFRKGVGALLILEEAFDLAHFAMVTRAGRGTVSKLTFDLPEST